MSRSRHLQGFRCACCGKSHKHAPTDMGFQLPDCAWDLAASERELHLVANDDFCAIDKTRFFIRGVVRVPFVHINGYFGWGLWVEVSKNDFFHYHNQLDPQSQPFNGRIANGLPGYPTLIEKPVEARPELSNLRPTLWFPPTARHLLAREQKSGIGQARHFEMIHENIPDAL